MRFSDFGSINKVLFVISAICLLISMISLVICLLLDSIKSDYF